MTLRLQPVPCSAPRVALATKPLLQLSLTEAEPNAAAICASVGLQGSAEASANVITGGVLSMRVLYWTLWSPQSSVTVIVITALHVPLVLAAGAEWLRQPEEVTVVAAMAAASAAATV